jgi:hypothetical protein
MLPAPPPTPAAASAACCATGDRLMFKGTPGVMTDVVSLWGARACRMMRLSRPVCVCGGGGGVGKAGGGGRGFD